MYIKCEMPIRPPSGEAVTAGYTNLELRRGLGCRETHLKSWEATELLLGFSFLSVKLYNLAFASKFQKFTHPTCVSVFYLRKQVDVCLDQFSRGLDKLISVLLLLLFLY